MLKPETLKAISEQNGNRKIWRDHDSLDKVAEMLLDEDQELTEAIDKASIGASAFELASELGDVIYLFVKYCQLAKEDSLPVPLNLFDILDRALYIADLCGFDVDQVVKMKIIRNSSKYQDYTSNNGHEYETAANLIKRLWDQLGGDIAFSKFYEIYGEDV